MTLDQLNTEIISCCKCPRLVEWREKLRVLNARHKDQDIGENQSRFGDPQARVLVVGLAPSTWLQPNRAPSQGRFGRILLPSLASRRVRESPEAESRSDDLVLKDMYITVRSLRSAG